jgi:oligoendopeptidase F
MAHKIRIKPENKGKLHKSTGTPKGEKIPVSKLEKAKHSKDPKTRKRATFALNARKWHHESLIREIELALKEP